MGKNNTPKGKVSFVYYFDWCSELLKLPDELRLKIDDAIKRFVLYGEEPTAPEVLYSMFGLIRTQISRDREAYEAKCQRSTEAIQQRWNTNEYERIRTNTNDTDNDKDKDNDNDKDKRKFIPPTLDEVKAYFREKGYREDVAQKAFDYYSEANWHNKDGKPIKNWKQTMIGVWFKDEHKEKQQTNGTQNKRHEFTA